MMVVVGQRESELRARALDFLRFDISLDLNWFRQGLGKTTLYWSPPLRHYAWVKSALD